jgi:hypothetical protein
MFARCLLACTDPAIRGLSKMVRPAPDAGRVPRIHAATADRCCRAPLDQRSRPSQRASERCTCRNLIRTVKPPSCQPGGHLCCHTRRSATYAPFWKPTGHAT